ncbi:uncharacterized protein BT62DRAFT_1000360 [Guyanagaster necrorhizus]|uniref:F-box domain-containing protein n=1 Tax=Guyanagaster necrorhizus TaxID=856835 RepID=A0A9P7W0N1_9AGAR|nr:uncharacterized protein BT62DRAFT_1000360 [Guyanagaster necrorhizus MCA 3950]KAG7451126.1 hypothetical protein BT62DRAFT_1000360 [Guyanagaster necrorhizus MCA 3950]
MNRLAQELVDEIIDHLDKPALKSCSLVSRSFLPRTRTHLFRHVNVDSKRRLQAIPRSCVRSVSISTHVGVPVDLPNVEHASFTDILYASDPFLDSLADVHTISLTGSSIFIRDPAVLYVFLRRFRRLTTLHVDCYLQFRSCGQKGDSPDLDTLHVELKTGSSARWVVGLVRRVRRLEVVNATAADIRHMLDAANNLQQLVLRNSHPGELLDVSAIADLSIDLTDQHAVDWWESILLTSSPRRVHIAVHICTGLRLAQLLLDMGIEVTVELHYPGPCK